MQASLSTDAVSKLSLADRIELLALLERRAELKRAPVVCGMVDPKHGFTHSIKRAANGEWVKTDETPTIYFPAILERALTSKKRFVVLIGGRAGAKSIGAVDIALVDACDTGAKTYCLREYQSSIKSSIHSLIKGEVDRLNLANYEVMQSSILYRGESVFEFAGIARNTDSIKSAHGFKRFLVEEAQFLTAESIQTLTPTARNKPNRGLPGEAGDEIEESSVSLLFVANPGSKEDPFSKKFINPYQAELDRQGWYEDDLRLIIKMNYTDNPWFSESGLDAERADDEIQMPPALYRHIWLGDFNDSVDNALIPAEWFDACIDAHVKLGFGPRGVKKAAHDASDLGPDSKSYAMAHGSVVLRVEEKLDGTVNEGGHWAATMAIEDQVDYFSWDGDGMGAALGEQMSHDCKGKRMQLVVFKGSESPDFPKAIYKPALKDSVKNQQKIEDVMKNKRAQYYFDLRDRCYRTFRAVKFGEYQDPDTLISFSSAIPLIGKLRAEVCRMPKKNNANGLNELYTKEYMKTKLKIPSPNLADAVMMLMRYRPPQVMQTVIPQPIRAMRTSR